MLCRSRSPDFLLDIIERQVRSLVWGELGREGGREGVGVGEGWGRVYMGGVMGGGGGAVFKGVLIGGGTSNDTV